MSGIDHVISYSSSVNVELYRRVRVPDGYGGFNSDNDFVWSGMGTMVDIDQEDQMHAEAARHELNMQCYWILPYEPEKNMYVVAPDGEYVIRGIMPEDVGLWRAFTVRKDS